VEIFRSRRRLAENTTRPLTGFEGNGTGRHGATAFGGAAAGSKLSITDDKAQRRDKETLGLAQNWG
jgi:hypothetical protein